jgi:uncharacterized cupredoxin-like copper-binding protein
VTPFGSRGALALAVMLLLGACAPSASSSAVPGSQEARIVAVSMSDDLRFDPREITVRRGETITFVLTNEGQSRHEFLIGDEAEQAAYVEEMASGDMHHAGDAGVSVEPGQSQSFTYTFDDAQAELLAGCHEPGHYDAGMVATITVTE